MIDYSNNAKNENIKKYIDKSNDEITISNTKDVNNTNIITIKLNDKSDYTITIADYNEKKHIAIEESFTDDKGCVVKKSYNFDKKTKKFINFHYKKKYSNSLLFLIDQKNDIQEYDSKLKELYNLFCNKIIGNNCIDRVKKELYINITNSNQYFFDMVVEGKLYKKNNQTKTVTFNESNFLDIQNIKSIKSITRINTQKKKYNIEQLEIEDFYNIFDCCSCFKSLNNKSSEMIVNNLSQNKKGGE